jgi:hypothetical protein
MALGAGHLSVLASERVAAVGRMVETNLVKGVGNVTRFTRSAAFELTLMHVGMAPRARTGRFRAVKDRAAEELRPSLQLERLLHRGWHSVENRGLVLVARGAIGNLMRPFEHKGRFLMVSEREFGRREPFD